MYKTFLQKRFTNAAALILQEWKEEEKKGYISLKPELIIYDFICAMGWEKDAGQIMKNITNDTFKDL